MIVGQWRRGKGKEELKKGVRRDRGDRKIQKEGSRASGGERDGEGGRGGWRAGRRRREGREKEEDVGGSVACSEMSTIVLLCN